MKILNLYAGIGGNRKNWGDSHEITAVELDPQIAEVYQGLFTNDKVVVGDAHQYLLDHHKEFDFIWSSPPCQTHSRTNYFLNAKGVIRYPDMSLYQEIIFLQSFHKGKYCVENVKGYYTPLVQPQEIGRHYFWSNFYIPQLPQSSDSIGRMNGKHQKACKKSLAERNAVNPTLGLHILNCAKGKPNKVTKQDHLFEMV